MGDLSGKHGSINVGSNTTSRPTYTFMDNNILLSGSFSGEGWLSGKLLRKMLLLLKSWKIKRRWHRLIEGGSICTREQIINKTHNELWENQQFSQIDIMCNYKAHELEQVQQDHHADDLFCQELDSPFLCQCRDQI